MKVEEPAGAVQPIKSHRLSVLLVDDQPMVGEAVKRMLSDQKDIDFHYCSDPSKAIEMASQIEPTVILQDLIMPEIDGLTLVKFFRANPVTSSVPLIVLSSREEPDIKSKAFGLGANDYMVKLPDKLEVVARIRYHSNAYINLIERNEAYQALLESQSALKAELNEAEKYVTSLLPQKLDSEELKTDWVFTSSTDLGGDAFGYHWLDDENFAIYLLDVCGHGVGAALLSVSAINVLRSQSLPGVDFLQPDTVLSGMNEAFQMEKQNGMYFTFWYGVYNKPSRTLKFSSGGHPPAVLISHDKLSQLATPGMVVGGMPGCEFKAASIKVNPGNKLYVFSDGAFEIQYKNSEKMMSFDEFINELNTPARSGLTKVESMVRFSKAAQAKEVFDDDFSLVEILFK